MTQIPILKHIAAVADPTRCRLLRILGAQELTVSELCTVLQLPQSTVSRHLKTLSDDEWIVSRRDGTSRFYTMTSSNLGSDARRLWGLVDEQMEDSSLADQDQQRLEGVLAGRRSKSREFFASTAGNWDRLRSELFGETFHFRALLCLLDETWTVGDLGCGTGEVTAILSPVVRRIFAVDGSAEMLQAARQRLDGCSNVELRQGELESLPLEDRCLDCGMLLLVLHYAPDPVRVLSEAARVLRPGGRVLIVDMVSHEREEYLAQMGHVWLGFSPAQIERYLAGAGFHGSRIYRLPPDAASRGPGLFAATARL